MFRKLQKCVKYVTTVTNVPRINISYMLIPQIINKYYFETATSHGGNSERNEKTLYWKAEKLNNFNKWMWCPSSKFSLKDMQWSAF